MKFNFKAKRHFIQSECNLMTSTTIFNVSRAITGSKLASWAFVLSLLLQLVSGDREAFVRVQPGGVVVRGVYAGSGPSGVNVSGQLRKTITSSCGEDGTELPAHFDDSKKHHETRAADDEDEDDGEDEEKEPWVGLFYLPPLEGTAGRAQGGTRCSFLEQVKQAMLFGASALLVLALNPGLFKQIELHFTTDRPIILISDPKEIRKFHAQVDLRKSKYTVNISAKPESTSKTKSVIPPKLTLWATCGRSSGGSKFNEWEGTVCLDQHDNTSSEPGYEWVWRSLVSLIICFYAVSILRVMALQPPHQRNNNEDLEETLQRLAKQSMSKMSVWKYKRKRYQLPTDSHESCAVCLDEFIKGQTIRMLPCHHQFHNRCVDSWLIRKRTCPLCKMDIIDQRFGLGKPC